MILDKYVDDKIKDTFNKYFEKYCKFEITLKRTRDILSDINYFTEHVQRMKKSDFLDYTILPSHTQSINNRFVKIIGESIIDSKKEENKCMIYVALYEIMLKIFDKWYETNSLASKEYIDFKPVLDYFIFSSDSEKCDDFIN